MKKKNIYKLSAIMAAIMLLAGGCGGAKAESNYAADTAYYKESSQIRDGGTGSYGYDMEADYKYEEPLPAAEAPQNYSGEDTSLQTGNADETVNQAESGRKLIKTVNLSIETLEFDNSCALISNYASTLGGYIESSNVRNNSNYWYGGSTSYRNNRYAEYTVRIPSAKLDTFIDSIGNVGSVTNESLTTEDITLSYLDIESRVKALDIQQERLFALLEKAESIEEIIALEDRISQVTYELEAKQSILKNYDNLVTFSTVYLYLSEVERVTVKAPETVGERISAGFSDTMYNIGEGFKNFAVWFVVNLPYIIIWAVIIALIVFVLVLIIKKCRKSGNKRRAKKQAAYAAQRAALQEARTASASGAAEGINYSNTESPSDK